MLCDIECIANKQAAINFLEPHLIPKNMTPVILSVPAVRQPAWTQPTEIAGGVMDGREGTQEVEHAADNSFAEGLRPRDLHLALQPQLLPGLLVRWSQVSSRHQVQALIVAGLGSFQAVGHDQDESPASFCLLRWQRHSGRHRGPD